MSKYYFFKNDNQDSIDESPPLPPEGASFEAWKNYMEMMEAIAKRRKVPPEVLNPEESGELGS